MPNFFIVLIFFFLVGLISGPYVDIEMRRGELDGYDAVYLSPHKFIGGPGSPGILLMNEDLYRIRGIPPSTSGGGTVLYVSGYDKVRTLTDRSAHSRPISDTAATNTPPVSACRTRCTATTWRSGRTQARRRSCRRSGPPWPFG